MIFHIISRKSSQNHQKFWPLAFPMCCRRRLVSLNTFPARSAQHGAGSAQARGPGLLRRAAGGESHICWIDEWGLYNVILIEVVWDYKATNITRGYHLVASVPALPGAGGSRRSRLARAHAGGEAGLLSAQRWATDASPGSVGGAAWRVGLGAIMFCQFLGYWDRMGLGIFWNMGFKGM